MEKISVLLISVPLMIVAIVFTLFADRIDTAVKGDKKIRRCKHDKRKKTRNNQYL